MSIRKTLKQQRENLSIAKQQRFSQDIAKRVLAHSSFQQAQHVACYLPMRGEVDTQTIIEHSWQQHKNCYLPIVIDHGLQFVAYTPDTSLVKSEFGFLQPEQAANTIEAQALDLVITPLVGFDIQCNRMGMGAGHYDRAFEFLNTENRPAKPIMLGIAYECQKTNSLKKQPWDVTLNYVITESKCYSC